jgi:glycosyltransferase involved in cell wall biosynthesis
MQLGIAIEDTWQFLYEIYEDLAAHHQVTVFKQRQSNLPVFNERINNYLFRRDFQAFLKVNDVVFFEWSSRLLAAASYMPKTCGIVTRLHRYEMYQWADKINWDNVDKIILVSEAKRREFITRFPEQALKTVVIPVAVSLGKFQPIYKEFSGDIGILCHLSPRKRVYELILAFYELNNINNNFHLHIGGGMHPKFHDYYHALHQLVLKLNLKDKATFYGNVTNPQDWYHKIDIFISNSYSEGLQVSPMEAMASGCYCLSHHWDGADELLPEANLYYASSELQEKILRYCESSEVEKQEQRERMRSITLEKFDIARTKKEIRKVVEGTLINGSP